MQFDLVRTADLIDNALDWVLASAKYPKPGYMSEVHVDTRRGIGSQVTVPDQKNRCYRTYEPSRDAEQGDKIIEQMRIATTPAVNGSKDWYAGVSAEELENQSHRGPTRLVAALRCAAYLIHGEYVRIPAILARQSRLPAYAQHPSRLKEPTGGGLAGDDLESDALASDAQAETSASAPRITPSQDMPSHEELLEALKEIDRLAERRLGKGYDSGDALTRELIAPLLRRSQHLVTIEATLEPEPADDRADETHRLRSA